MKNAAEEYGSAGFIDSKLEQASIKELSTTEKSRQVAESQLSGELPKGFLETLRQQAAEAGLRSGTSGAMSGERRTLRDFGVNQLQYIQQGVASASALEELSVNRQVAESQLKQSAATLDLQAAELNQKWATALTTLGQSEAQLAQSFLALQSSNRNYLASLENQLIISNASVAIPNFVENLAKLGGTETQPGYFEQTYKEAQTWVNRLRGV